MWDLALSEHGDLVISGHRDLLGRSGNDLTEQRMRIRLLMHRGSWVLDRTIGSNLRQIVGMPSEQAAQAAPAFVREALRHMDEIVVDDVVVTPTSHDITVIVRYRLQDVSNGAFIGNEQSIAISLPVAAVSSYES